MQCISSVGLHTFVCLSADKNYFFFSCTCAYIVLVHMYDIMMQAQVQEEEKNSFFCMLVFVVVSPDSHILFLVLNAYAYVCVVFLFTYILLLNFQEGGVFTFGNGSYGQLGHNSFNHEYNPRKVTSTNLSLRCTALICNCSFKTNSEKEAMFCNCWGIGLLQQWVMRCSHP